MQFPQATGGTSYEYDLALHRVLQQSWNLAGSRFVGVPDGHLIRYSEKGDEHVPCLNLLLRAQLLRPFEVRCNGDEPPLLPHGQLLQQDAQRKYEREH